MRRALAALLLVLTFLTVLNGTASARAVSDLENRVEVFGSFTNNDAYAAAPQGVQPHRENTVIVYDPATGVWLYVDQNPWTWFDPEGLEIKVQTKERDDGGRHTTFTITGVTIDRTGKSD